jgi:predicted metal-dependent hydrolase
VRAPEKGLARIRGVTDARRITIDGTTLTVLVQRKRVKNINARLDGATVRVSAPLSTPRDELERTIHELARTLLRRARATQVNHREEALTLAQRVATRFPEPPAVRRVVFVTNQRAQWGSYSPTTGTIRLNAALRQMPRFVLEAVVTHELAHAVHLNHTPEFWALVRRVCPATDRANAFLEGVTWLSTSWDRLPPVERALLTASASGDGAD